MSDDVLDVVRRTIRRRAMLAGGETVLVAVSGGADSTALLHVLVALAPEYRLQLHVLHVDHGLRADSARDADAVQRLAGRLGVPVEVARVAVEPRGSIEAAAREARYAALEARADAVGAHRIAVGHTGDDQAETVLMRLLEGAGLRGLAAIPPTRGRVIRPLLDVRCADLRAWLGRAGLSWIDDPTNRDPKFLRNRVRHELLPALRALHGADVSAALIRVARQARGALETIERLAAAELERWASVETDVITLPRSAVAALPPDVAVEVLRQAAPASEATRRSGPGPTGLSGARSLTRRPGARSGWAASSWTRAERSSASPAGRPPRC